MFLALTLCLLQLVDVPIRRFGSEPPNAEAVSMQAALDGGLLVVSPGVHRLNVPLRVKSDTTIRAESTRSVLEFVGTDGRGLLCGGANGGPLYKLYVSGVCVKGGSISIDRYSQNCVFSQVWVSESPSHGFVVMAGEGLVLRDCVAWQCGGDGVRVQPAAGEVSNSIVLDNMNSQGNGGAGVRFAPLVGTNSAGVPITGECFGPTIRGSVVQGNVECDIAVMGMTRALRIESCWLERSKSGRDKPCLVSKPLGQWYPGLLTVCGNSVMSCCDLAFIDGMNYKPRIESLLLLQGEGRVKFSGFDLNWLPSGEMIGFDRSRLDFNK